MANQLSHITHELDSKIDEIQILLIDGYSVNEIHKLLGYSYTGVYNAIRRNGLSEFVSANNNGKSRASKAYVERIQKFTKDSLTQDYHILKLNLYEIAEKYNMSASGILYNMRKLGVKTRDKHEANELLYQNRPELREIHRQNAYEGKTGIYNKKFNRRNSSIERLFEEFCIVNQIPYQPQYQINGEGHHYDFLVYKKLLIEVDGNYWHNTDKQKSLDNQHNQVAQSNGYDIIRFTDSDIKKTKGKCFDGIKFSE